MAKSKKMKFPVQEAAGIIAGSLAAGFVSKLINDKLPNVPSIVRALIPVGAGLFLAGQKNAIAKNAGLGMIAAGGTSLAKAFIPGIGAGVDDLFLSEPADMSILSLPADQSILAGEIEGMDEMGEIEGMDEMGEIEGMDEMGEIEGADEGQLMGADDF
jgi:hypothetical protein